jgi:hypothetical protein
MPKIKRDFNMRLFAFNIDAGRGGYCSVTGEAHFIDFECARTRVFDLFYLIGSWLTKPFVSYLVIKNNVPDTLLTRFIFILFASNGGDDYNGDGSGKFFHIG